MGHSHGERIHLPVERSRSRKCSPDAVSRDPKLASHSLALSCVSSARLIGLKKKSLVTEISSSASEYAEGPDLLNKAMLLL